MIYALLRLRVEVFVVELGCVYQELDGHDLDRTTRHYWLAPDGAIEEPQATLRLFEAALAEIGDAPCVLDSQLDCVELFGSFGFVIDGPKFTEDGIPLVPM